MAPTLPPTLMDQPPPITLMAHPQPLHPPTARRRPTQMAQSLPPMAMAPLTPATPMVLKPRLLLLMAAGLATLTDPRPLRTTIMEPQPPPIQTDRLPRRTAQTVRRPLPFLMDQCLRRAPTAAMPLLGSLLADRV